MRRFEEANCEKRNSRGTHSLWHSRKTTKVNRKNQNEMIFSETDDLEPNLLHAHKIQDLSFN